MINKKIYLWVSIVLFFSFSSFYLINIGLDKQLEMEIRNAEKVENIRLEIDKSISNLDIENLNNYLPSNFNDSAINRTHYSDLMEIYSEIDDKIRASLNDHKVKNTLTQDMALQVVNYLDDISDKEIVDLSLVLGVDFFVKKTNEAYRFGSEGLSSLEKLMLSTNSYTKEIQILAFSTLLEQEREKVLKIKIRRITGPILRKVIIGDKKMINQSMAAIAENDDGKRIAILYYTNNLSPSDENFYRTQVARSSTNNPQDYANELLRLEKEWYQSPNAYNMFNRVAIRPTNRAIMYLSQEFPLFEYCTKETEKELCSSFVDDNGNEFDKETFRSIEARKKVQIYKDIIESA